MQTHLERLARIVTGDDLSCREVESERRWFRGATPPADSDGLQFLTGRRIEHAGVPTGTRPYDRRAIGIASKRDDRGFRPARDNLGRSADRDHLRGSIRQSNCDGFRSTRAQMRDFGGEFTHDPRQPSLQHIPNPEVALRVDRGDVPPCLANRRKPGAAHPCDRMQLRQQQFQAGFGGHHNTGING